ncbi:MAG: hypothetical protein ACYTG2_12170, partial [Planctomycetota bacterium]
MLAVGLPLLLAAVLTNLPGAVGSSWAQPLFQGLLWSCVLGVLFVETRARGRAGAPTGRAIHWALAIIALFAAVSHVHFGRFHGDGRYLHHNELFSNGLGSKYFEELGYDGLYLATHRALIENDESFRERISVVKNLHTYQLESASIDLQRSESVAARFTEARWHDFKRDVRFFQTVIPPDRWQFLLVDHGFNATPFWTALASVFSANLDIDDGTLALFVSLDLALIAALLLFVRSTFGLRTCLLFAIFFFANAFSTFDFTGGALLRQVWFVCLVGFVGFTKQGRMGIAGFLLGVAALERAFPLVFVLLPAVHCVKETVSRRSLRHGPARLLVSLTATFVGLGLLSAAATGGLSAWTDWYANISSHNRWFFINQISLRNLFIVDPFTTMDILGNGWDESRWLRERQALDALTGNTLLVVRGILCALLALAMTRRRDVVARLALLAFLPFVLFYTADYYYVFLAIVVLAWRSTPRLATVIMGLQIPFWLLRIALPPPLHLERLHWIVSLCLAATLVPFLAAELLRGAREHPAFRRGAIATLGLGAALLIAAVWIDRSPVRAEGEAVVLDVATQDVRSVHAARAASEQVARWGNAWSRNDHLSVLAQGVGARVSLGVPAPADGAYRLRIHYSTAPSFGVVQPSVQGVEIGQRVNLYSPRLGVLAVVHDEISFREGTNDVTFTVVGSDPASTEHHFAIDTIALEPGPTSRDEPLDRALAWLAAHPADLYDGGREVIGAEIRALYGLWSNPRMAARRPALRSEIEARLRRLGSVRGDWVLPGESG